MLRGVVSILLSFALLLAGAGVSHAQRPHHPQFQKNSPQPVPILKVNSRLVIVDVVVTNNGTPVRGLPRSDFRVFEDGARQTIRYFTPHFASATPKAAAAPLSLPPGTYINLPIAHPGDSVTVLLLDTLNTSPRDLLDMRRATIRYLKKQPSGQRIAVFVLGNGLRMLQGFTTNPGPLLKALRKAKDIIPSSLLPSADRKAEEAENLAWMRAAGMPPATIAMTNNWMGRADANQTAARVRATLTAMQELSRYLAGIPGRKNLVWFSGSFPLEVFSVVDHAVPSQSEGAIGGGSIEADIAPVTRFNRQLKETANMLAQAHVAVYPVDARGLQAPDAYSAMHAPTGTGPADYAGGPLALSQGGPEGGTLGSGTQLSPMRTAAEHNTMHVLARQTGGRAFYQSNDLQEAMADALRDGSNFYTLAYVPTNTKYNGAQRHIRIRLAHRNGYKLFYRRSYYADAGMTGRNASAQGSHNAFLEAMRRGVPSSSQIIFKARVLDPDKKPPSGPVAGAIQTMKHRAARYTLQYAVLLSSLHLTRNADGLRQGRLDALAIAYGTHGKLLNWVENIVPISLDQATWKRDEGKSLLVHQTLDLPAGEVHLRVGLYDAGSGRFGSMGIPIQVKARKGS